MTIVWADTTNLPSGLAGITNFVATSVEGVNAWPLWVTIFPESNTVTVLQPWSDEVLTEFSVPDGFPSWLVYETNLYPSCLLIGIPYTNWETLVEEGYTQFSVPQVMTHAWLADISYRDAYWNNVNAEDEAQAATAGTATFGGSFMSMDDDDGGGGGDPCSITNLTQPFYITSVTHGTNGTTITWQSCQLFRYLVFSANQLSTNTAWTAQSYTSYVWGQTNSSSTTWTDAATTNNDGSTVTQRFYRVQRLLGSPIAAGQYHSLALTPDGTLWSWGDNTYGEIGDGTTVERSVPTPLSNNGCGPALISNVVAVSGGHGFSVAADATGRVWTWGENNGDQGLLGNGAEYGQTSFPGPIAGVSNVVAVAAGNLHTLALRSDGTVWAWGSDRDSSGNPVGQLGVGGLASGSTNSPIQSLTPPSVVVIAGGYLHSAAVQENGTVWTWGAGGSGQLGNGGTTNVFTPAMLTGISNAVAIAAGDFHTVALTADRKVWTWGDNSSGQLGRSDPNGGYDPLPEPVPGLSNVVAIAAGSQYTLAVATNGQLFAWGDNTYGQLGTNVSDVGSTGTPMRVPGISNVVMVAAGDDILDGGGQTLVVTIDQGTNHYWAWGQDYYGQVGNGTNGTGVIQSSPTQLVFSCVQLIPMGTGGTFQVQCTGTLRLFFNDDNFSDNYVGSYSVTISNLTSGASTSVMVGSTNQFGVAVGTVTNGVTYSYSATGYCCMTGGTLDSGCEVDANGNNTSGEPWSCDEWVAENAPCPCAHCYSLVGRIN
jgi:alpha-tubulin suppressor-like RCC1 family protein